MEPSDTEPLGELDHLWSRAIVERAWWLSSDDRDDRADAGDRAAADRDAQAEQRDRSADQRDAAADDRVQLSMDRAVRAIKRLALADDRSNVLWAESVAAVGHARARHEQSGTTESAAALQAAERESEVVIADLVRTGMERDDARAELRHIAQHLAAADRDRRGSATERADAAADRQAARQDRAAARSDRKQAAAERAYDEGG